MPSGLAALMARAGDQKRGKPPVEKWNPPFCGDLDIRIASDGTWSYMSSPIAREALVELFASVLRKDKDGRHYLVTPVEKIGIQVEDVPFLGVELHAEGTGQHQNLIVRTNVGDVVTVDKDHPIRFDTDPENGGLKPYVLVRGRLEARLARPLLYELAEFFEESDSGELGLWSSGDFFPLAPEFLSETTT
ncbi:DUF1285 domain-containing protein [Labrenzia sp. CE80]|uniref:DUF1285 domain-containing protein n=1 Tax=Labrenzia sp. CE80 TaxID=1788986 RepID=UPI00129AEBC1|nr:DUF1285 domain-containing protein [Labrenzia sp. CE80]